MLQKVGPDLATEQQTTINTFKVIFDMLGFILPFNCFLFVSSGLVPLFLSSSYVLSSSFLYCLIFKSFNFDFIAFFLVFSFIEFLMITIGIKIHICNLSSSTVLSF